MSTINGTVIFQDDFANNGPLNSANWDYVHWTPVNNASFLGVTQFRQELPLAEGGIARIRLDTWLDGNAFSGSDATTRQAWLPDSTGGIAFEGQFRFTQVQGEDGFCAPVLVNPYGEIFTLDQSATSSANADGRTHIRNFGENTFGFEDNIAARGADFDYNDMTMKLGIGEWFV